MSNPGVPAGDDAVKNDFLTAQAGKSNYDWILNASSSPAGGNAAGTAPDSQHEPAPGATPRPAAPAAPSAGNAPDTAPFGVRLDNYFAQYPAQRAAAQKADLAKPLPTATQTFTGDIGAAWDSLKKDVIAAGAIPANYNKLSEWDKWKSQFEREVTGGKSLIDAFNLVTSPVTAGFDVATTEAGKAIQATTGVSGRGAKEALDVGLLGLGPKGGEVAAGAEASAAAAGAKATGAPLAAEAETVAGTAASGAKPVAAAPELEGAPKIAATGKDLVPAPETETAPKSTALTEQRSRAFDIAGEQPGAKLTVTPELRQKAGDYLNGSERTSPIDIHLDQFANDATRNAAVQDIAKIIPKDYVKPVDVTRMGAYSTGLTPDEVMSTLRPKFASDEMFDAAAMVMNSAGEQFWKASRAWRDSQAPEDLESATRAYALFNKYAGDFRDAKTDWGRAGRIQQETAGKFSDFTKNISDIIHNAGADSAGAGGDFVDMHEIIRKAAALEDPAQVPRFVSALRSMTTRDALLNGFYNIKLSNPRTILKKLQSDVSVMAWHTASTYAAETLGAKGVQAGEAAALFHGYTGAFSDAMRLAGKALREGSSQFEDHYQTADGRSVTRQSQLAAGMDPAQAAAQSSPTWHALDYLRAATPTSWMAAADDWAKYMNYAAERERLFYRDGTGKGLSGDALSDHINNLRQFPPFKLDEQAKAVSLQNTFTEPLSNIGGAMRNIVDWVNIPVPGTRVQIPLGRMVMPFIRVAANIPRFAARQTPLGLLMPSVREDLAAGGARRSLALAKVGLGTAMSTTFAGLVAGGQVTGAGPSDPSMNAAWRRAGHEPYSIRFGDKWISYRTMEPAGTVMGAIADTFETFQYAHDAHQDDFGDIAGSLAFGVGNALLSKTYLQQFSDLLDALRQPDKDASHWINNFVAGSIEPAGLAGIRSAIDPWLRLHYGLIDNLKARTPGLSSTLPANQDQWGRDIPLAEGFPVAGGLGRALSPDAMAPADNAEPIDKWVWQNRQAFPEAEEGRLGLTKPGLVQSFRRGGVSTQLELQPNELHRLRELAGNGTKDPASGMGALETLNALVTGKHPDDGMQSQWNAASPETKALMTLRVWNKFKGAAQMQLLNENGRVRQAVGDGLAAREDALKPANNNSPAMPNLGAGP